MKITIEIDTDNAAFDVDPMTEVAGILGATILKLENLPVGSEETLYDTNGNRTGFVRVSRFRV
jgi:hypothetical protein